MTNAYARVVFSSQYKELMSLAIILEDLDSS